MYCISFWSRKHCCTKGPRSLMPVHLLVTHNVCTCILNMNMHVQISHNILHVPHYSDLAVQDWCSRITLYNWNGWYSCGIYAILCSLKKWSLSSTTLQHRVSASKSWPEWPREWRGPVLCRENEKPRGNTSDNSRSPRESGRPPVKHKYWRDKDRLPSLTAVVNQVNHCTPGFRTSAINSSCSIDNCILI